MTNPENAATLNNGLPAPPIPQRLREMLKDYPEHLQRLQQALNQSVDPGKAHVMPFDEAIWALEGALEGFVSEARKRLKEAQASQDAQAVERANEEENLMLRARSSNGGMRNLHELAVYFESREGRL